MIKIDEHGKQNIAKDTIFRCQTNLLETNLLLSKVPRLNVTEELLWSRRQLQLESEAENAVDVSHEVQAAFDFRLEGRIYR